MEKNIFNSRFFKKTGYKTLINIILINRIFSKRSTNLINFETKTQKPDIFKESTNISL